jgi:serine/threonine-protein kinase
MAEGTLLAGKYRLVSLLGRGGMGSVWRAQHLDLDAPVAVKLLDPSIATNPEGIARFHREAQAAAALRSPHVVQILDRGLDDATQQPFIVMELMEGESLSARIARLGLLSPEQTARIATHIARALGRAHDAGIVHRDLKPDNVFLVQNEDEEVAKVLDFGIAKSDRHRLDTDSQTRTGAVMGTPYYMSPEQISGSKNVDYRTDIWALGVIACECLTGRRPFDAETIGGLALKICAEPPPVPSQLGPVSPEFDAWFSRATARDQNLRFRSAREAADELRRACGVTATAPGYGTDAVPVVRGPTTTSTTGLSSSSTSATTAGPAPAPVPAWVVAGGIGTAVVLVAGGAWFFLGGAKSTPEPAASSTAASATAAAPVVELPPEPTPVVAPAPVAAPTAAPTAATPPGRPGPTATTAPSAPSATAPSTAATTAPTATPTSTAPSVATRVAAPVQTLRPSTTAKRPSTATTATTATAATRTPSAIGTAIDQRR